MNEFLIVHGAVLAAGLELELALGLGVAPARGGPEVVVREHGAEGVRWPRVASPTAAKEWGQGGRACRLLVSRFRLPRGGVRSKADGCGLRVRTLHFPREAEAGQRCEEGEGRGSVYVHVQVCVPYDRASLSLKCVICTGSPVWLCVCACARVGGRGLLRLIEVE